ncbi:MAG: Mov34/MPN/PAD-1 family protein, partial [Candidatus Aenigmarchaeota archaeon]|nr:Mov34/MPN/PAD-1 family protein [Candidatus Aenigmarchaeota archaeon]
MDFRDVFIGKRSFKTLIASAIEVYSRETNGALLGRNTTMNIDGVKKKVLSIKDVYPIQTEKRKRSEVSHGNIAAFERFLRAMRSLKTNIVGGFHSHPHPYEG